ncbi:MAG: DNA replication and repair protein RecF [Candidatus Rokuibacteriota bacterium]
MQIGSIQLVEFRNYQTLSYRPFPRLNLLTGRNAQGKTNLLEAVAVLVTGRSFRTSRLGDVPRWGAAAAVLSGDLLRSDGSRSVRRSIQRLEDGSCQTSGDRCPWARVIAFGWHDLAILNGGPQARRNFIDGFAARLFPGHLPALLRYRQIVSRRNHLLQRRETDGALAPWNEQLAAAGMELIDRRRRAVAALQTELARVYPALAGARHKVEIGYRTALGEATEAAALLAALERLRPQERRRGLTLAGPHRDDLAVELDGVDARAFGSRGQQRLLALALRLSEVLPVTEAAGTPPVLLLDDALSELDPGVRDNVLREIQAAEQVFLTSPDPLDVSGARRFIIEGGGIAAA